MLTSSTPLPTTLTRRTWNCSEGQRRTNEPQGISREAHWHLPHSAASLTSLCKGMVQQGLACVRRAGPGCARGGAGVRAARGSLGGLQAGAVPCSISLIISSFAAIAFSPFHGTRAQPSPCRGGRLLGVVGEWCMRSVVGLRSRTVPSTFPCLLRNECAQRHPTGVSTRRHLRSHALRMKVRYTEPGRVQVLC